VGARFSAAVRTGPGAQQAFYKIGTRTLSRGWIGRGWLWPPTPI